MSYPLFASTYTEIYTYTRSETYFREKNANWSCNIILTNVEKNLKIDTNKPKLDPKLLQITFFNNIHQKWTSETDADSTPNKM